MKMAGRIQAENKFGQLMICLRMSKLDYLVKETPYSAYITIRKKFLKNVVDDNNEAVAEEGVKDDASNVVFGRRDENRAIEENNFLKQKLIDLEKNYAMLNIEHDEIETKVKVLEKDKVSLEEELEESFAVSREFKKSVEKQKMYDTKISMLEKKVKNGDMKIKTLNQKL